MKDAARELVKLARLLVAFPRTFTLKKDVKTKKHQFEEGTQFKLVSWRKKWPYNALLEDDQGRRLAVLPTQGHKLLNKFPKPPNIRSLERTYENRGLVKAVDGKMVEVDGFSPSGAPSWGLVLGIE